MKKWLLSWVLLLCFSQAFSQPSLVWAKPFGNLAGGVGYDIQPTEDGNLIVLASVSGLDSQVNCSLHGGRDMWVYKMTPDGNIIWQNCYGGSGDETGDRFVGRILTTADHGYAFICNTASFDGEVTGDHADDVWVVKIDSLGTLQWEHCYGGGGSEGPMGFTKTPDGGYIFSAFSNSPGGNGDIPFHYGNFLTDDAWVVKIDSVGGIVWNKVFGGTGTDMLSSIGYLGIDTIILSGYTNSNDGNLLGVYSGSNTTAWIVALDADGNLLWNHVYSSGQGDFTSSIITSDDKILSIGPGGSIPVNIGAFHGGSGDVYAVKTNRTGVIIWQGLYGGSAEEAVPYDILIEAPFKSGYYLITFSWSADGDITNHHGSTNEPDYWIIKLDTSGHLLWENTYGGSGYDQPYGMGMSGSLYPIGSAGSVDGDIMNPNGGGAWTLKIDDLSGISEVNAAADAVKIYPNPNSGSANIQSDFSAEITEAVLEIYTPAGVLITKIKIESNLESFQIDVPDGIYFYRLVNRNNQLISSGDLVVQHP